MIDVNTIDNILICFRLKSTVQAHKRIVTTAFTDSSPVPGFGCPKHI